jgi:ArsR family transcriptional regulator
LAEERWQLYRLLSDPTRLRLLALAAEDELAVGELAELLDEQQPNVSRHAAPLRQAGLLSDRRQGARTLVQLAAGAAADPVVADALAAGRRLCATEGSLQRVAEVIARRDARAREFFEQPRQVEVGVSPNLPVYLSALAPIDGERRLAVDAGTGDGVLLDLLAPLYARVIGFDRSAEQLRRAGQRVAARGYTNVTLVEAAIGAPAMRAAANGAADLVVASRVLHHAPRPRVTLRELGELLRPGGRLLVIDYARHDDEVLREQQADVWMGFAPEEICEYARDAGLVEPTAVEFGLGLIKTGPDAHLPWLRLVAAKAASLPRPAVA